MARKKPRPQKRIPSKFVGLVARHADGGVFGEIIDVIDLGGGEIVEIRRSNGKTEMLPNSDRFIRLSADKTHAIIQPFEFVEATPEKS